VNDANRYSIVGGQKIAGFYFRRKQIFSSFKTSRPALFHLYCGPFPHG